MLMIDRKKLFDQPIKNDLKTYDNIRKIATNQDDDYATECLLDCPYFKTLSIDCNRFKQTTNIKS